MDILSILNIVFTLVTGVGGWFVKLLWNNNKEIKEQMEALKLELAKDYVRRDDFKEAIAGFKAELRDNIGPLCDKINKIDDYLRDHSSK